MHHVELKMSSIKTIVFQGDSITDAGRAANQPCNENLGTGYVHDIAGCLLSAHPEREFKIYNTGTACNKIVDLYARWKVDALNLNPDLISIMIGINDIWHEFDFCNGVECDRYEFIYRELLKWSRNKFPCIQFILIDPFILSNSNLPKGMATEVASRRIVVKKLAREFHALHLDTQELFDAACNTAPTNHWSYDGVHPTIAGHRLLANAWLELFKKITVV